MDGGGAERVSVASLHAYCIRLCEAAGMPGKDAATLATFLVEQDVVQGGRMSHGTRCLAGVAATDRPGWQDYLRRMMPSHDPAERVNPTPAVSVVRGSPTARLYDGDGGMGHIVCAEATEWAIGTARKNGCARSDPPTTPSVCCCGLELRGVGV